MQARSAPWAVAFGANVAAVAALACSRAPRAPESEHREERGAPPAAASATAAKLALRTLPPTAAAPLPSPGGTLRVHLDPEPPHLNPLLDAPGSVERIVVGTVYEPLVACRGTTYEPALARRWAVEAEGRVLALTLRADARFHDGSTLGPVDVQASFEFVLRRKDTAILRALLSDVAGVDAYGDGTVRVRLSRPSGLALRALCDVPILPARLLRAGADGERQLARHPVGSGPFRFVAWERHRRVRLARAAPAGEGGPLLDEVVFEIDGDGARALSRLRRGEIDLLPRLPESYYPEQVAPPSLRERSQIYLLAPERYSFLAVNQGRPPLADPRVRRALSLLWDRETLARELHRGLARPIGAPPFAQVPAPRFAPAEAAALLEAADLIDRDGDGLRESSGGPVRLRLLMPTGAPRVAQEARVFTLNLRRAGVLLEIVPLDAGTLMARVRQRDFDLAPLLWEGRPDADPRPLFAVEGAHLVGAAASPDMEATLASIVAAPGPAARAALLQRLGALFAEETPAIFLYRHDVIALASRRIVGLAGQGDRFDFPRVGMSP